MKKQSAKIDWDTVELIGDLVPTTPSFTPVSVPLKKTTWPDPSATIVKDPRVKLILSGASAKARARGPSHTHTQLRKLIPAGIETFIYAWWLVTAAIESDRDVSRGVEIAAHAIFATSQRYMR